MANWRSWNFCQEPEMGLQHGGTSSEGILWNSSVQIVREGIRSRYIYLYL